MMSWPSLWMRLGAQNEVYGITTAKIKLLNNVPNWNQPQSTNLRLRHLARHLLILLLRDRLLRDREREQLLQGLENVPLPTQFDLSLFLPMSRNFHAKEMDGRIVLCRPQELFCDLVVVVNMTNCARSWIRNLTEKEQFPSKPNSLWCCCN